MDKTKLIKGWYIKKSLQIDAKTTFKSNIAYNNV